MVFTALVQDVHVDCERFIYGGRRDKGDVAWANAERAVPNDWFYGCLSAHGTREISPVQLDELRLCLEAGLLRFQRKDHDGSKPLPMSGAEDLDGCPNPNL